MSDDFTSANSEQAEFWGEVTGPSWVRYKPLMDEVLAGVLAELLVRADLQPSDHVLDLGCGTGASTEAIGRIVTAGRVVGTDISTSMLGHARKAVPDGEFLLADSQTHAFEPAAFDKALSRFGTMFYSDPVAAFSNIGKALKPGGRLVMACWNGPENNPWFTIPAQVAIERLGPPAPADPHAPGPMAFADTDRTLGILSAVGFRDTHVARVEVPLTYSGGFAKAVGFATQVGPADRIIRELSGTEEDRQAIALGVSRAMDRFRTDEGISVPADLLYYSGRWPG